MKANNFQKNSVKFMFLILLLIHFSIINSNPAKKFLTNKYNKYNKTRFLAQTINDVYQTIKTNLLTYSHPSPSQEFQKDDYIFQLTTTYNEEKVLDGTYSNTNELSIIDLDQCKTELYLKNSISTSLPLIIIKLEKKTNLIYEKNIQYEVYNPTGKSK